MELNVGAVRASRLSMAMDAATLMGAFPETINLALLALLWVLTSSPHVQGLVVRAELCGRTRK